MSYFLVVGAALVTSFLNALSAFLQRKAAGRPQARDLFSGKFIAAVSRNKLWLFGLLAQVSAFGSSALALSSGSIAVVDPILTTDLVFLFFILRFRGRIDPGAREWVGVVAISVGLGGFLAAADPVGHKLTFQLLPWMIVSAVYGLLVAATIFAVRRMRSPKLRAALTGTVTGFSFSLIASFTKLAIAQYRYGGLMQLLTTWQVYALVVVGIASMLLLQNTYGAGPLSTSQPAFEISDPVLSIVIAVFLFGDTLRHTLLFIVIEVMAIAVMIAGVIAVGGSHKLHPFGPENRDGSSRDDTAKAS